jgi:DNA-nicking Smr family endonuclease
MGDTTRIIKSFADLPGFLEENRILLSKREPGGNVNFREEMKDVQKVPQDGKRPPRKPVRRVSRQQAEDPRKDLEASLRDPRRLDVTNMPEYMEGFVEGVNPLTMEKLRQGQFSSERDLDLHGFSIEDADDLFALFIEEVIRSGLRCVKVIHGRGLNSKGRPVLKERLKAWIIRAMNRKWVVAFASAPMCHGGPGATFILLKQKPRKDRICVIG